MTITNFKEIIHFGILNYLNFIHLSFKKKREIIPIPNFHTKTQQDVK